MGQLNVAFAVVSYSISTSNHNTTLITATSTAVVSYSISTSNHNLVTEYVKQHCVVSYSISTSNHNCGLLLLISWRLYLIPFLHQTTTASYNRLWCLLLYLIPFLHQTTTSLFAFAILISCILFHFYIKPQHLGGLLEKALSCILFHFYIKPQLNAIHLFNLKVVSYSISTSNHNITAEQNATTSVVSYSISTSNHNRQNGNAQVFGVVSYSISTSNHNRLECFQISHMLYLIPFLHQTTTKIGLGRILTGCILFHFYIKPQLRKP